MCRGTTVSVQTLGGGDQTQSLEDFILVVVVQIRGVSDSRVDRRSQTEEQVKDEVVGQRICIYINAVVSSRVLSRWATVHTS